METINLQDLITEKCRITRVHQRTNEESPKAGKI